MALSRADFYAGVLGLVLLTGCHVYDSELVEKGPHAPRAGTSGHASSGAGGGSEGGAGAAGEGEEAGSGGAGEAGEGGGGAGGMLAAGDGGEGGESGAGAGGSGGDGGGGEGGGGTSGAGTGGTGGQAGAGGAGPCGPANDCCPNDPLKYDPGICGCGTVDGACGCGAVNMDSDGDGQLDCNDSAPYGWMRALTLDGAQVSATLANFPVLVRLTDAHLGANALANGNDIYFTAADKTTVLDFEIERFTSPAGALVAWVRVPSLAAATDTVIYLGYDDGKTNRSDAAGVWSGYHNVWHLAQTPNGANSITDSTGAAPGTPQGSLNASSSVAGVAGQAITFDGNGDQIAFTNNITGSGATTFSGWVNQAADSGDNGAGVVSIGNGSNNQARFLLSTADQSRVKIGFFGNDDQPTTVLTLGSWSYVVWVWDGAQSTIYVNGANVLGPTNHAGANTSGSTGRIGADSFGAGYHYYMTGQLDEIRIATVTRPAAWVAAEYANQRPGATFIKTVGASEAAPSH